MSSTPSLVSGRRLSDRSASPGARSGRAAPNLSRPLAAVKDGKSCTVTVHMLDDTLVPYNVQLKWPGRMLFEMICQQVGLIESDYFGLEYYDVEGEKVWLDMGRPLSRQLAASSHDALLWLCVKFYTPDPAKLEDELTRYLFSLQIRRDLAQGQLRCNNKTAAVLASYIVQSEQGDWEADQSPLRYRVVPSQDAEMERRILESHRRLQGQTPGEAELNLLETARRCQLYGVRMHPAQDHEGVPLNLAVAHMGLAVYQHFCRINTFSWGKIRKISFKRRRFLVKLHPDGARYYKDTVEFFFETRNMCKNFWKKCVEHHGFFRCLEPRPPARTRTTVLPKGSSFRFSGRTQKQVAEFARENVSKQHNFSRSQSFRSTVSLRSSSLRNMGTSLSANPLIPVDMEQEIYERTAVSLSSGSAVTTSSAGPHSPPSLTDHDNTSRAEVTTSVASSLPPPAPARPGHISPDSELSSAPTDTYISLAARRIPSRLSRSSPSLTETPEESDAGSSGVHRQMSRLRQLSRDSSSLSSVVEINTATDRRQILDDTVWNDCYQLLQTGMLSRASADEGTFEVQGSRGEVNLIPYGTDVRPATCRPVLVPGGDHCEGPLILPPEQFSTQRPDRAKTLPRAAAGSGAGAAGRRSLPWSAGDRLQRPPPPSRRGADDVDSPESPSSDHGEYRLPAEIRCPQSLALDEWLQVRSVPGTLERAVLHRLAERRSPGIVPPPPQSSVAAPPSQLAHDNGLKHEQHSSEEADMLDAALPGSVPLPTSSSGTDWRADDDPSTLSESSHGTEDESTLQYDTVPDDVSQELEAPAEFSDRPAALPPVLLRLCYSRRRPERGVPGPPPGCGHLLQVTEEEEEGQDISQPTSSSSSSSSSSSDGEGAGQETASGEEADFPSPPSSLLEPLRPPLVSVPTPGRPVHRVQTSLPVAEAAPPQRVVLAGSDDTSSSERAETGGADSEPDGAEEPLEELPGDGEARPPAEVGSHISV